MKNLVLLTLTLSLAACNEAEYSATLTKPLQVKARQTVTLPTGEYHVKVRGSVVSKVELTNSSGTTSLTVKTSGAKRFRDFINEQNHTYDAAIGISASELNQPFGLSLSRKAVKTSVGSVRSETRECVAGTYERYVGERCDYEGSFCQTERVCNHFGDECYERPINSDCRMVCRDEYETVTDYGTQNVRFRDVTYRVTTQTGIIQNGKTVGSLRAIIQNVNSEDVISSGPCN